MKPIYWILIIVVVAAAVFFWLRSKKKAPGTTTSTAMVDLSAFDPVAVRNAQNECELMYNTNLEVNNCAYQKLTGVA